MWLTFGRNLTKRYSYRFGKRPDLHNPYAGGYYPTDISLRMRMRWWQKTLYYSKKRYRKHYATAINKHSKGTYFFDYGNAFLLEASRAGADIMADNHIDFKYWVTYRISWGPCVLIMVWSFPLGLCFRKTGGFTKTDTIACQVLEEMAKNSTYWNSATNAG
jgi:urocanate hydratase